MLTLPRLASFLETQSAESLLAVELWRADLARLFERHNVSFLQQEQNRWTDFFRTIEKSPLTDEQIRAVVCFDNRVQVVAAAGSGKTSTMVAKAGYAVSRRITAPE